MSLVPLARHICEASNGRAGCSCARTNAVCQAMLDVARGIAPHINITTHELEDLAAGRATVRRKKGHGHGERLGNR